MNNAPSLTVHEITYDHPQKKSIINTFFTVSDFLREKPIPGACHLMSAILHVLLCEQNIQNKLCIGEVKLPINQYFDHSWIQINDFPFDVAIQYTLDGSHQRAPIFAGFDLSTANQTDLIYGEKSPVGIDSIAKRVAAQTLTAYLDGAPNNYGWKAIKSLGRKLGMRLDVDELKQKYADKTREYICHTSS